MISSVHGRATQQNRNNKTNTKKRQFQRGISELIRYVTGVTTQYVRCENKIKQNTGVFCCFFCFNHRLLYIAKLNTLSDALTRYTHISQYAVNNTANHNDLL